MLGRKNAEVPRTLTMLRMIHQLGTLNFVKVHHWTLAHQQPRLIPELQPLSEVLERQPACGLGKLAL